MSFTKLGESLAVIFSNIFASFVLFSDFWDSYGKLLCIIPKVSEALYFSFCSSEWMTSVAYLQVHGLFSLNSLLLLSVHPVNFLFHILSFLFPELTGGGGCLFVFKEIFSGGISYCFIHYKHVFIIRMNFTSLSVVIIAVLKFFFFFF